MAKEIIVVEINRNPGFLDNPVEIVGYVLPDNSETWNGRYTKAGYFTNFLQGSVTGGSIIEIIKNGGMQRMDILLLLWRATDLYNNPDFQ